LTRNRARWVRRDHHHSIDVGRRVRAGVRKGMVARVGGVAVMLGSRLTLIGAAAPDRRTT